MSSSLFEELLRSYDTPDHAYSAFDTLQKKVFNFCFNSLYSLTELTSLIEHPVRDACKLPLFGRGRGERPLVISLRSYNTKKPMSTPPATHNSAGPMQQKSPILSIISVYISMRLLASIRVYGRHHSRRWTRPYARMVANKQ